MLKIKSCTLFLCFLLNFAYADSNILLLYRPPTTKVIPVIFEKIMHRDETLTLISIGQIRRMLINIAFRNKEPGKIAKIIFAFAKKSSDDK